MELEAVKFWWLATLIKGELLPAEMRWLQRPGHVNWPAEVSSRALYDIMASSVRALDKEPPSEAKFASDLNSMTFTKLRRITSRWKIPDGTGFKYSNSIVNIPPLIDCRGAFESYTNHRCYAWPDIEKTPANVDCSNLVSIPPEWLK